MFGATLTFIDELKSLEVEPNAAKPQDRISTLKKLHEEGIKTWASIEPVIDPVQSLALIEATMPFVDQYKIGKMKAHINL